MALYFVIILLPVYPLTNNSYSSVMKKKLYEYGNARKCFITNLEKVPNGHCVVREAMNKHCFQQTFGVMQSPASTGNTTL